MRLRRTSFAIALVAAGALGACSSDDDADASDAGGLGGAARGSHAPGMDGGASGSHAAGASGGGSGDGGHRDAATQRNDGAPGASDDGGSSRADAGGAGTGGMVRTESPWGVAPSHSSSVGIASWAAAIAESGVDWIRGFDQGNAAGVLPIATANGYQVSGIFDFSDPGGAQTFPVNSIAQFEDYVTNMIADAPSVKHFEVWNEPPNFSENKSPEDYAKIVIAAYDAAKAADPSVQVGLAAQSVNLNFMAQALDAGAAGHFDYVTVHPYETLGLVDDGWEAQFMGIVPTIRKLLADKDPGGRDVPVWFTELGEPVQNEITPEHQADTLVKAYVMGIAQGAWRIHWFEPLDGDSGPFGLIGGGDGSAPKRPSFTALATLIEQLGKIPSYTGWLLLNDAHYAFVFEGEGDGGAAIVAWSAKGVTDSVELGVPVQIVDLHTATRSESNSVALSHSPLLVRGVPEKLVEEARDNARKPFPWGGDYSAATSVSYSAADGAKGLHPLGAAQLTTIDGAPARDASQGAALAFTIDPNFCSYCAGALKISAVVRLNGGDAAGFNLKYESTSGWQGTGSWYGVPGSDQWYTQTWTLSDPQFVGKWGYHFAFDSDSTDNSKYSIQSVTVTKQ